MHKLQRAFMVVGIPIVASCLTFIFLYIFAIAPPETIATTAAIPVKAIKPVVVVEAPVRLVIPRTNTDATIKPVGLTASGDMDIDDSIVDVTWYQSGFKPGQKGSAVIAGHYGWKNSQPSVFNDLHTLQTGDEVFTYDQKGVKQTFVVREIRKYDPQADATEVFKSTDTKAYLNLITCGGTWINAADSYSDRLVVFTDLEG